MWIPKTEEEIVLAVQSKSLEETETFDAKAQISPKNVDTAKDVAALANSGGGVLIYGIGEDESGAPTVLSPIELKGQRERIEAIIKTSIDEVPVFKVYSVKTEADSSKGYLVVFVPPSERAPHMVIADKNRRYYGRGETGNYRLTQSEVAKLYERRAANQSDIMPKIDEAIKEFGVEEREEEGYLYVIVEPVSLDDNILEKALAPNQKVVALLNNSLSTVLESGIFSTPYEPNIRSSQWTLHDDGYFSKVSTFGPADYDHGLFMKVNFDGSGKLVSGRAAELAQHQGGPVRWFFSDIVAGNTIKFIAFFGKIYEKAGYWGAVNIAVGLTGIQNSTEYMAQAWTSRNGPFFAKSEYRKSRRVSAIQLIENPQSVAAEVLMPLINAVSQGRYNPFTKKGDN